MRALVRRYITNEQRTAERQRGVTEDDCNEIKQDISALRFELIEMLGGRNSNGPNSALSTAMGKRGRKKERRLMKGFDFNLLFADGTTSFDEDGERGDQTNKVKSPTRNKFVRLARGLAGKRGSRGNKWKQLIEATRTKVIPFSRSSESVSSVGRGSTVKQSHSVGDEANISVSPDHYDANTKRNIFARKSLLPEESQSQENDESDINEGNEGAEEECNRKEHSTLVVSLPVPIKKDLHNEINVSSTGKSESPSKLLNPSPDHAMDVMGSTNKIGIGLTQSRSRNEWI